MRKPNGLLYDKLNIKVMKSLSIIPKRKTLKRKENMQIS
jgi:hypothetical protein